MQNVASTCTCDSCSEKEPGKDLSGPSSPNSGNTSVHVGPSLASLHARFIAEISESDDDDVSEVESFILEQSELDDDSSLDTSKFLLANDPSEACIDVETQRRLEALFEASGNFFENGHIESCKSGLPYGDGKSLHDRDVLRRLTTSVSSALDEAAAALNRMRTEPLPSSPSDHEDCRTIAEACSDGDINAVKRLLNQGSNINEISEEGESLLSLACSSGYYELAQLLLAMNANIEDRGLKDTTPLMEAASAGHLDIVKLLIQHGADVNAQTCQEKRLKGAKNSNADLHLKAQQEIQNNLPSIVCPEGNTPLMFACAGGHETVARDLLDAGANVEDHNENGHTPLMEAASAGHVEVARLLVERGASINTHSNEFKESALTLACYKGHLEMVRFLLEAGADQEHKTDEMHTALMEASMDGHVEVARLLLDSGAQVNMPADSFESPLTLAACGGHTDLAMLLLERGANIEEVNDEGYTPLMEAAREGHEEMVALLLSQGADINAQTEETQETALTLACCGGFLEVVDFLIKAGADIELGASTPLMEAAQEGHLELVRYLINSGANVNATTATGDTALTYACENGHTDVADMLIQASAKLEHESEGGRTPLMKAARAGHMCTVQFLINKGSNVNKQTSNNDHNPLSLACAGGHLPIVELLLAHGADPTHKLKDNSTMLIEASKGGHTSVVQLLLDYPNSLLASPPPPPDLTQVTNQPLDLTETSRVPTHGLHQVYTPSESDQSSVSDSSYISNIQSSPRIQELLQARENLQNSPQAVHKQKVIQRKLSPKSNEAPSSSFCENLQRFQCRNKANVAAQANLASIQAETKCAETEELAVCCCAESGGGGVESGEEEEDDEDKSSERLEACISSMMQKAELFHPSPEEQILQKQQILEELQRVERELSRKSPPSFLFASQQPQQGFASMTSTTSPRLATIAGNTNVVFPTVSGAQAQQLLINSGAILDIESLSSTVMPDLSAHLGLNLRTAVSAVGSPMSQTVQTLLPPQLYQHSQKPGVHQPTVTTTHFTASDHSKIRQGKQPSKQAVLKQIHQQYYQMQQNQLQSAIKIQSQAFPNQSMITEDMEKLSLRNVVLTDQQQIQQQPQPQLVHQNPQQQFVLSEITQNLTLRANNHLSDQAVEAIALMQAAGGLKFATDSTQTHSIPMFDPVTVGQALLHQQLQQQQQLQHQQLTHALQETKRQQQVFDKSGKGVKCNKSTKSQQTVGPQQVPSLQAQSSQQALKHHLAQTYGDACALVSNIPVDATSVLTLSSMGAPAFPVSLAVTPGNLSAPILTGTNCGALAHNLALEEGLMVAAPASTLHDTLGEIMTGPTTQLAGNQLNLNQQCTSNICGEPCSGARSRSLSLTSLPGVSAPGSLPLTFHTLTPSVTPCVPIQVTPQGDGLVTSHHFPHLAHSVAVPSTPAPPLYPPLDLNSQTDSNHDTALTLACAGGHEELVTLLLSRGADIEHRDKKGFTPLMLASTAGHSGVVEILLNHAAEIEAQSERTKDTALSLACSGGRYEVVDILLARGANKEHRNVSDYTPLSLAASGGYVNIIKLLLSHGAEINSRTGSKLGISPLMLAAMNGHTQAVKLLLDMGSDINAQIETNRNTALTLACFQGRHEVVSLLLDRKANVEHRAKTGLTPLMEAASGGYVDVGKVLIDKGADVNAPPVPSSRDTALTIAADKGHYRFVDLLLQRDAIVDVKNKKGNSPLWLAANGGHLDVVQLLVANNADIDSQDNRKVSCLMAAFRKGHIKTVKWMVKHVSQFPSEQDVERFISTISDKDFLKKANTCAEAIRQAKDRQAAEANKNANILLEELDLERSREEIRKAAAARRRERKRRKKREKQEQLRAAKAAAEESKKSESICDQEDSQKRQMQNCQSDAEDEYEEDEEDDDEEEEEEKPKNVECLAERDLNLGSNAALRLPYIKHSQNSSSASNSTVHSESCKGKDIESSIQDSRFMNTSSIHELISVPKNVNTSGRSLSKRDREKLSKVQKSKKSTMVDSRLEKDMPVAEKEKTVENTCLSASSRVVKKRNAKLEVTTTTSSSTITPIVSSVAKQAPTEAAAAAQFRCLNQVKKSSKDMLVNGIGGNVDYDEFCNIFNNATRSKNSKLPVDANKLRLETDVDLSLDLSTEVPLKSPSSSSITHCLKTPLTSSTSPKKWQKRDEGWKEVVRRFCHSRSKKVSVPSNAISRVIGRGGCNINAIREGSGAHIEVEKQKGQGDRTIIIRGSAESTRLAQHLITALIKEPEKELSEILTRYGINRTGGSCSSLLESAKPLVTSSGSTITASTSQVIAITGPGKGSTKLLTVKSTSTVTSNKATSIPPPSLPANSAPPFSNQSRPVIMQSIRPGIPVCTGATPPFLSNSQSAWTGVVVSGKVPANIVPRPTVPLSNSNSTSCATTTTLSLTTVTTRMVSAATVDKSPVIRQLFPPDKRQQGSSTTTSTKTTVSYTMAVIAQGKTAKTVPSNVVTVSTKVTATSDTRVSTIAPSMMERAGSAPPSVINSHMGLCHNSALSSVQPFSANTRPGNGVTISQQQPHPSMSHISRIQRCQNPTQSKPFVSSAPTSNQVSPTNNPLSTVPQSTSSVAPQQVYTPFCHNNIFGQVTQPFVYSQKEKECSKPNFASVAASGVTSVASQVQNSNPIQSTLTLSLPQTDELVVDAAKAPGYRGNLHISPSASSSSSSSASIPTQTGICGGSNFGPIGSGPRSAPCTPPLGPIGPPSSGASTRRSTPPVPSSPPPSIHARSLPESHSMPLGDLTHSMGSTSCGELQSQQQQPLNDAMFHHQSMSSHAARLQSYPLASSFSGPAGTNTTFSQHSPLSSVGNIAQDSSTNNNLQVVQSNLNPNAPDFSSRTSLLMAQHGPPALQMPRLPNTFQDSMVPPHLAAQFRPILASGSAFPMHAITNHHHQQAMNRFAMHHGPNHQQSSGEYGAPQPSGPPQDMGGDSVPLLGMMGSYPTHPSQVVHGSSSVPHYPVMHSMMGIRPSQRSTSSSSKDGGSPRAPMSPNASPQNSNLPSPTDMNLQENPAGTIGEDRKLPRPIGMERAQRKNPMFGSEMQSGSGDWIQNMQGLGSGPSLQQQQQQQQDEANNLPQLLHNAFPMGNRFADMLASDVDQHSYQQVAGANVSGGFPFVNGLPAHLLAAHMYQTTNNATATQHLEQQMEMWNLQQQQQQQQQQQHKVPLSSSDGLPQNVEHNKMTWQNWGPHQA